MAASNPTPAAAPDPAPPSPPITTSTPAPALPWWMPQWPQVLGVGIFAMTWWLMWMLAPAKGGKPSDLFNMLAQAIVLTGFIGSVVAAVYTASRDSAKKNETIAAQAKVIASQTPPAS